MTVALIFGGRGYEREVSIAGAGFVYPRIPREKYKVIPVLITHDGRWMVTKKDFLEEGDYRSSPVNERPPELPDSPEFSIPVAPANLGDRQGLLSPCGFLPVDVAFPLLHGDFGEDGVVQGALENAKIKFVGEDAHRSATCLDKRLTHLIARRLGIPTASAIFADISESCDSARQRAERLLGYPLFIKPACLGSSVGACPAHNAPEFDAAYREASVPRGRGVLIEELVRIDSELEIGVLVRKSKLYFTNIGKIKSDLGFYNYKEKYESTSSASVDDSPVIDACYKREIRSAAARLCKFLGLRSLARIDFFLTKEGKILFNEINTMPGFTGSSLYPRLAASLGCTPEALLDALISEALI